MRKALDENADYSLRKVNSDWAHRCTKTADVIKTNENISGDYCGICITAVVIKIHGRRIHLWGSRFLGNGEITEARTIYIILMPLVRRKKIMFWSRSRNIPCPFHVCCWQFSDKSQLFLVKAMSKKLKNYQRFCTKVQILDKKDLRSSSSHNFHESNQTRLVK